MEPKEEHLARLDQFLISRLAMWLRRVLTCAALFALWEWAADINVDNDFILLSAVLAGLTAAAAALFGLVGGLVLATVSLLLTWYFVLPPQMSFAINDSSVAYCLVSAGALALLMSIAAGRKQRSGLDS